MFYTLFIFLTERQTNWRTETNGKTDRRTIETLVTQFKKWQSCLQRTQWESHLQCSITGLKMLDVQQQQIYLTKDLCCLTAISQFWSQSLNQSCCQFYNPLLFFYCQIGRKTLIETTAIIPESQKWKNYDWFNILRRELRGRLKLQNLQKEPEELLHNIWTPFL